MDWDWDTNPTYESERLRIDGTRSPVILYDMRLPRQVEDDEVGLMLSIADHHLKRFAALGNRVSIVWLSSSCTATAIHNTRPPPP